jgi:hypothetical protein
MSVAIMGNIGGWIGRGIAQGDPIAFVAAAAVMAVFVMTYRLMVWWRTQ